MKTSMKLVPVICCILFASVCWSQGPYPTAYQGGSTDITTFCTTSGNNCWRQLSATVQCDNNTVSMGGDGLILCKNGLDGYPYSFNAANTSAGWIKQTAMGTLNIDIYAADSQNIWSLRHTTYCDNHANGTFGIFNWTGTAWNQPNSTACLDHFSIAPNDYTIMGLYAGQLWESTNNGVTYTQIGTGTHWGLVSVADVNHYCVVDNYGTLYVSAGSALSAFSPSPGTGVTGCGINTLAPDQSVLAVSMGSNNPQVYNWTTGTWAQMPGIGGYASQMALFGYGSILILRSDYKLFHWNVYAGTMKATVTGSTNGCPTSSQQCTGTVYHDGYLLIQFPHGHNSTPSTSHVLHNVNMNMSNMDWSEFCDPMFGDPSDPECVASNVAPSVTCEVSQFNFQGPQGNPPPPPPSVNQIYRSIDGRGWDGSITYFGLTGTPGQAMSEHAYCGMGKNACNPPTTPSCPTIATIKTVGDECSGPACNQTLLETSLKHWCKIHDPDQNFPIKGSWMVIKPFILLGMDKLCPQDETPPLTQFWRWPGLVSCQ